MDDKGFITGIRSRFFKNDYYAWEVPQAENEIKDPYIAGQEVVGNERRVRRPAREMGFSMHNPKDFILATKKDLLNHYPSMINSQSVRAFEAKLYEDEILNQKTPSKPKPIDSGSPYKDNNTKDRVSPLRQVPALSSIVLLEVKKSLNHDDSGSKLPEINH